MGSLQKRGDNTYLLTVSAGFGLNGKRQRYTKTITAKSEKEAEKELHRFEVEVESQGYVKPEKMTFESFAKEWVDKYGKPNLAPKTLQRYKELLDLRIIPAFKNLRLEQIRPQHLLQFYENLADPDGRMDKRKGTLSEMTIKHHHRLLHTMLEYAVKWQIIPDNVAKRVSPPKVEKKEAKFLNEQETLKLVEALNIAPLKYKSMMFIAIYTGMRKGELMGLRWVDVDFDNNTLSIIQTSQYVRGLGTIIKSPKTKTSTRIVSIPSFVIDLLKQLRDQQEEDKVKLKEVWNNSGMVFTQDTGEAMHPETITKWFKMFLVANSLTPIHFHGLRHTNATLLISQNMDILTISKRLGHAKTSTTMDIYGHLLQKTDRIATEKLENLFNKKGEHEK